VYCFTDAKRNMAKEPKPREGGTRQMEGMDLESVVECARDHDAEALGEIYRRYVRRVFGLCRYMLNSREWTPRGTWRKNRSPARAEPGRPEGMDLKSVIECARGHDAEALGEIYRRCVRRVFGLCRYMLNSRESAEDATSEVFLKLQHSIESYDRSIPFLRWLLRVAGNQCVDALRRRQRGRRVIVEAENGAAVIEAPSTEPSPLGAVISKEERAKVRDTIARLGSLSSRSR
jgi:RNA polymerase sigma factor (sigma-70 family)